MNAQGIYVPETHEQLLIAGSGKLLGNMDPRFDDSNGEAHLAARRQLVGHVGLNLGEVAAIGVQDGRTAVDEFEDLGDGPAPETDPVRDGFVTTGPIGLMLNTADCTPLVMFEPDRRVLGLAHLGWSGIDRNLHGQMLDWMEGVHGADKRKVIAYLAPSIGPDSYVRDSVGKEQCEDQRWEKFIVDVEGGVSIDFPGIVAAELKAHRVAEVIDNGVDVGADPRFFSYRRFINNQAQGMNQDLDGGPNKNGRNGFVVAMRP